MATESTEKDSSNFQNSQKMNNVLDLTKYRHASQRSKDLVNGYMKETSDIDIIGIIQIITLFFGNPWYYIDIFDKERSKVNKNIFEFTEINSEYLVTFGCSLPLQNNFIHKIKLKIILMVDYVRIGISPDIDTMKKLDCNIPFEENGMIYFNGTYGELTKNTNRSHCIKYQKISSGDTVILIVDLVNYQLSVVKNDQPESRSIEIDKKCLQYFFFVNVLKTSSSKLKLPKFELCDH